MKTLLLFSFLCLLFLQINAQCRENATNFGNNSSTPSYNVSGDVSVTLNNNNTITLDLGSNFATAAGPDVRAFLVNSEGKSITELKNLNPTTLDNIPFGLISCRDCNPVIPSTGAQSITVSIPKEKDITKFNTVFLYCLEFNAFWDLGTFTSFSDTNCNVLDINSFKINQIKIYPNPAKNKIQILNTDGVSSEIRIFNVLGKQVFHQSKITEKTIDLSSFKKGIYIVKINVDGKFKTQKLVIQQ